MKIKIIISVILIGLFVVSCKKDKPQPTANPLVFSSLTAVCDSVAVNALLRINAVATGDNLTYTWESTGVIIGSGASVDFQICHKDIFTVKCIVTDGALNTDSKTITVRSYNP